MTLNEFESELLKLNIKLTDIQKKQLEKYYEMLIEYNKIMNLTGITEKNQVYLKHFYDSITLVKIINLNEYGTLCDIGTGAGFPGLVLKIVFPKLKVTLLDSLNKRINFLKEVITELSLTDIEAIHGRAEEFGRKEDFREGFDLCVSRAVANLATLSEYCIPYVKTGGYFIPYKSGNIEEELAASQKAIKVLGACVEEIQEFNLPGSDIGRSFVKIKKLEKTKQKYPRMGGKSSKEPIK